MLTDQISLIFRKAAVHAQCSEGPQSAHTDEMCLAQKSGQFPLSSRSLTALRRHLASLCNAALPHGDPDIRGGVMSAGKGIGIASGPT